jgi:hypothetical protein
MKTIKISNLPRTIANISTSKAAFPRFAFVIPMDRPTVPNAEANSKSASSRLAFAVAASRMVPTPIIDR